MAAMSASFWINEKMSEWLGKRNVADTLAQSIPHNVASEVGLALLDVADVIRPFPEVIDNLQNVKDENSLAELVKFEGGQESRNAIVAYLDKYGMRCVGEIDITRTRWSEKPSTLVPLILSNIKNFEPGVVEGRARVVLNMGDANLEDGDILVTAFTDPSWTPLFVSIMGAWSPNSVGLMTHGAVIAREYGLSALVGVDNATG